MGSGRGDRRRRRAAARRPGGSGGRAGRRRHRRRTSWAGVRRRTPVTGTPRWCGSCPAPATCWRSAWPPGSRSRPPSRPSGAPCRPRSARSCRRSRTSTGSAPNPGGPGRRFPGPSPCLGRVLVRAGESGAAVAPALRSLAADCRAEARAATEAAVRRARGLDPRPARAVLPPGLRVPGGRAPGPGHRGGRLRLTSSSTGARLLHRSRRPAPRGVG